MKRPRDEENLENKKNTKYRNKKRENVSLKRPREENNSYELFKNKKEINLEDIYTKLLQKRKKEKEEEEEKLNRYFSIVCL